MYLLLNYISLNYKIIVNIITVSPRFILHLILCEFGMIILNMRYKVSLYYMGYTNTTEYSVIKFLINKKSISLIHLSSHII